MEPTARRICRLPPQLANQIAAGEVVERPASVVKELVENSLDAGADEILVEAEEGGVRLLRVRDNGCGIHRDDLALALSRHATSKVQSARDLLGIASLGFRGEALASIASVSRLRLISRARESDSSWTVTGESDTPAPASHPAGTTIEMRDLFFNVPARRKFLRAERTEYEHLEEAVRRLAIGNFAAGFAFRHNGRMVFSVPPATDTASGERRLGALLGRPFLAHAAAIDFEAAGLRLRGWIGAGDYTRSQADVQYVYLNGRAIRDRVVGHALRQVFEEVLQAGRFPAYVLYLEMDPAQVDVNVHPTKHEVRFREARLVHDFLVSALRNALGQTQEWPQSAPAPDRIAEAPGTYDRPARAGFTERRDGPGERGRPRLVAGRFLLAEGEEGLVLVDALHLVREEARLALVTAHARGTLAPRPLLMPAAVRVGAKGVNEVERSGDRLRRLGVDLQAVSAETVRILAVPDLAATFDPVQLAESALAACAVEASDEALLHACADSAVLPRDEEEWLGLAARAGRRAGFAVELDSERLARLVREGG